MIARAHIAANDGLVVGDTSLPEMAGVDLPATVERIIAWGGDPAVYAHVLHAALAVGGTGDPGVVRGLGAIAGWRAGVLDLRTNALGHAEALPPAAVAAALALHPAELAAFLAGQQGDAVFLPGAGRLVARVGGFRGFGGPWPAPPTRPRPLGAGRVTVRVATADWTIHADVFGFRLVQEPPPPVIVGGAVDAVLLTDSHLIDIVRVPR